MPTFPVSTRDGKLVVQGKYQENGYGFVPGVITVSEDTLTFVPAKFFPSKTVTINLSQITAVEKYGAHTVGDGYWGHEVYTRGTFGFVGFLMELRHINKEGLEPISRFAVWNGGDQLLAIIKKHLQEFP